MRADSYGEVHYQIGSLVMAGFLEAEESREALSSQERLLVLKETTTLTWEQIARIFGVSKRSVMNWRAGGRMSAGHEETLTAAQAILDRAPDGVDMRNWLMTLNQSSGRAPFQELLAIQFGDEVSWIDRQPQLHA